MALQGSALWWIPPLFSWEGSFSSWREDNERLLWDVFGAISAQLWINNILQPQQNHGLSQLQLSTPPNFPVHPLSALLGYFDIFQDLQFRLGVVSSDLCSGFLLILPSFTKNKAVSQDGLIPIPGPESSSLALLGFHLVPLLGSHWLKADVGQTKAKECRERGDDKGEMRDWSLQKLMCLEQRKIITQLKLKM